MLTSFARSFDRPKRGAVGVALRRLSNAYFGHRNRDYRTRRRCCLSAGNEIISASLRSTTLKVDIADPASIQQMYRSLGKVDAVVSAAGPAKFAPLAQLSDADFRFSLDNKLMGQVNVVRIGFEHVQDGGSFTLTAGSLAQAPMPGSAAVSLVNAGIEGFARAAALEAPRRIRVNAISPPWVTETLQALKMDLSEGLPAGVVARAYVRSVTGTDTGSILKPSP